jgi:hypothetical protein
LKREQGKRVVNTQAIEVAGNLSRLPAIETRQIAADPSSDDHTREQMTGVGRQQTGNFGRFEMQKRTFIPQSVPAILDTLWVLSPVQRIGRLARISHEMRCIGA